MNSVSRMPNQSSAGATLKTVLGSVNSIAVAVGNTFDIVTEGVSMAHNFVETASLDQKDRHIVHRDIYRGELLAEANLRKMKLNDTVVEFVGTDPKRQELWSKNEAHLNSLFAAPATN